MNVCVGKRTVQNCCPENVSVSMGIMHSWLSLFFPIYLSIPELKVCFCNFLFLTQGVWNKKDFSKSMGMLRQWSGSGSDTIMERMWTWLKRQMYPQLSAFLDFFFKNFQSQLFQAVCTCIWCNFLKVITLFDSVFLFDDFKSKTELRFVVALRCLWCSVQ